MIGRTSIIVVAHLVVGALLASTAAAQAPAALDSAETTAVADSTMRRTPQMLAPMNIIAERNRKTGVLAGMQARIDIHALERENRQLRRTLARQGEEIVRLEDRLTVLQDQESRMIVQIAGIDSATAATRAQRRRLEARLRSARAGGSAIGRDGSER